MLDNISYYIALYETKNYRRCAKKLGIQPSTLSKHISELEQDIKQQLIIRTSRRFEVTEFGEYLYSQFKHIPAFVENAINTYKKRAKKDTHSGTLNVALGPDLSYQMICPYINNFLNSHPNIKLNINFIPQIDTWPSANITIALSNHHINGESLENRFVRKEYFRLYCSREYALKYGVPIDVTKLNDHNIIGLVKQDCIPQEYYKISNRYTNEDYVIDVRNNQLNVNTVLQMKQIGKYSDFIFPALDCLVYDELQQGDLVMVLPEWIVQEQDIYIISKKKLTNLEQLFIEFLHKCMGKINFVD